MTPTVSGAPQKPTRISQFHGQTRSRSRGWQQIGGVHDSRYQRGDAQPRGRETRERARHRGERQCGNHSRSGDQSTGSRHRAFAESVDQPVPDQPRTPGSTRSAGSRYATSAAQRLIVARQTRGGHQPRVERVDRHASLTVAQTTVERVAGVRR